MTGHGLVCAPPSQCHPVVDTKLQQAVMRYLTLMELRLVACSDVCSMYSRDEGLIHVQYSLMYNMYLQMPGGILGIVCSSHHDSFQVLTRAEVGVRESLVEMFGCPPCSKARPPRVPARLRAEVASTRPGSQLERNLAYPRQAENPRAASKQSARLPCRAKSERLAPPGRASAGAGPAPPGLVGVSWHPQD